MWTTKIKNIVKDKGIFSFVGEFYKDGVLFNTFLFERVSDPTSINQLLRSQLNQYKMVDDLNVPEGDVDLTIPVVPTPPSPTAAEIAQTAWLKDYATWVNIKTKLIDTGILTGSETAVTTFKTKVQNNFKPAYLALL